MFSQARQLGFRPTAGASVLVLIVIVVASAAMAKKALEPAAEAAISLTDAFVGLIVSDDISSITTPTGITIAETLVAVGDQLVQGQPIARIDDVEGQRELVQLNLETARSRQEVVDREQLVGILRDSIERLVAEDAPAQLALAEREVQQVPMRQWRDSPERAEVAYEQAVIKARRLEELAAAGLVPKQDVEEGQFAVRLAADDLANARRAAEANQRVQDAEVSQSRVRRELSLAEHRQQLAEQLSGLGQARFRLTAAQMRSDAARDVLANPFVRAARAGAVIELPVHPGDRLASGALVARMSPLDPMAIDIDVAPSFANMVRAGDVARVEVPAIDATDRPARIRSIAPLPGDDGHYAVRLFLPNPTRARLAGQVAHVRLAVPARHRAQ